MSFASLAHILYHTLEGEAKRKNKEIEKIKQIPSEN